MTKEQIEALAFSANHEHAVSTLTGCACNAGEYRQIDARPGYLLKTSYGGFYLTVDEAQELGEKLIAFVIMQAAEFSPEEHQAMIAETIRRHTESWQRLADSFPDGKGKEANLKFYGL